MCCSVCSDRLDLMQTQTFRSGAATMMMWIGPIVALIAVVLFVPLPLVLWATSGDAAVLLMLLFVPVGLVAGLLLHLAGRRSRVELTTETVSWRTLTSAPRTVPFSAIQGVEVPTARRGPRSVRLHLRDGAVVPVTAVSMSGGEGGNSADAGYLRTAQAITDAHRGWWMHHGQRR